MIVNAKNANAGVGPVGEEDAQKVAEAVASELGVTADEVITASTGVIGQPLSIEPIKNAIPVLVSGLTADGSAEAAEGIMTTDTKKKET